MVDLPQLGLVIMMQWKWDLLPFEVTPIHPFDSYQTNFLVSAWSTLCMLVHPGLAGQGIANHGFPGFVSPGYCGGRKVYICQQIHIIHLTMMCFFLIFKMNLQFLWDFYAVFFSKVDFASSAGVGCPSTVSVEQSPRSPQCTIGQCLRKASGPDTTKGPPQKSANTPHAVINCFGIAICVVCGSFLNMKGKQTATEL